MREIKFRVWDKDSKVMDNVVRLEVDDSGHFDTAEGYGNVYHNFELMEYTGLEDNNRKDVYEGDLIQGSYPNGKKFYGVVVYDEMGQRYVVRTREYWVPSSLNMCHDCEVIGNIYEDKDLLWYNEEE